MKIIRAVDVNDALQQGMCLIYNYGVETESRVGPTLEIDSPVATIFLNPKHRVLIDPIRDANPFFHLMESLWILAGRNDTKFLNEFNKQMINYSDNGTVFNAAYGDRIRNDINGDQLEKVVRQLDNDPGSRQAVIQIWDTIDLDKPTKDKACNMSIVFRVRGISLDMTVFNRSNDMIWGAYGANVVQFSMIHEYIAARLNLPLGTYTQITNSFHVYTKGKEGVKWNAMLGRKVDNSVYKDHPSINLVSIQHSQIDAFDLDLIKFFKLYEQGGILEIIIRMTPFSDYFTKLVIPMLRVYLTHKEHGPNVALEWVYTIKADDWNTAAYIWLTKRIENLKGK